MKTRFTLLTLLVLLIQACNLGGLTIWENSDMATGAFTTPFVPEGGVPTAPMLEGEQLACTHYVAPDGDDNAAGTQAQPWASFQRAADTAQPGDTVCFRDGEYRLQETVHLALSGSAETPIAFVAYPEERPVLDGGGEIGGLLIFDQHASHLRVSGFALRNFTAWGIDLSGENRYIQLDHLMIDGGEAGMHFTYGEDSAPPEEGPVEHITVHDSLIFNSQYTGVDCTPGPCNHMTFRRLEVYGSGVAGESSFGADGLAVSRGYPVLVEDCYIHHNGGDGIDLNSRDRQGHATGVVVRRNRVVSNRRNGIKLWAGGRIENNIVWGQGNSALWLGTFHSSLEVVNNTIAFNMWDPSFSDRNWAVAVGYPEDFVALPEVDLLLANNIFAFNTGPEVGDPTGIYLGPGVSIEEHHNLYFSNIDSEITAEFLEAEFSRQAIVEGGWMTQTGQGQHDLTDDPLMISGWPAVDVDLRPASPAIDSGENAHCPAEDALGNPRPVDGNGDGEAVCDIGAIEWPE